MKMKRTLVFLTLLASFFIIPLILHAQAQITAEQLEKIRGRKVTAAEVKEANDLMRKWMRYYDVMDNRRFHIKGEVVDEQGNRLTGVTMWVTKAVPGGWWQEVQYVARQYTINGTFEVRESGCEDVRLGFEKGGYYRQSIRFSDDAKANTREIQEKIMKGLPVEEPLVGKEGLRIVMEKKGEQQVSLGEYNTPLIYNMDGSGEVLDFDLPRTYPMRKVGDISETDTKSLPPNCLYMIAEKDEAGNIVIVDKFYPRKIRVIMQGEPGSGFIVYKPKDRYQSKEKSLHEMKQAPESGYEPTMVLEAEDIKLLRTPAGVVYGFPFYCKIKNNYGKGLINGCSVSKDGKTVFLNGRIFYNRAGSRNLESIYDLN